MLLHLQNGRFAPSRDASRTDERGDATPIDQSSARRLSATEIGASLEERATLIQFLSAFCSPCRATRTLLTAVALKVNGVGYVDVDAESHLALVRALNVLRTPTVMVLDADGAIVERASGLSRKVDVIAALGCVIGMGVHEKASQPRSQHRPGPVRVA